MSDVPVAVDVQTGEVVTVLSVEQARTLTDQIAFGLGGMWQLVKQAYEGRAWVALDYPSWDEYCDNEFGATYIRLPREDRQEAVNSLRESGLSIRAIAAATGSSVGTVPVRARAREDHPSHGGAVQTVEEPMSYDTPDWWRGLDQGRGDEAAERPGHDITVRAVRNGDRTAVEIVCSCGQFCDWDGAKQRVSDSDVAAISHLHRTGYVDQINQAAQLEAMLALPENRARIEAALAAAAGKPPVRDDIGAIRARLAAAEAAS
jgi:hypothetical protein